MIKDDDLVVGTHGRSFYILDDITPLRQAAAMAPAPDVHLFAPQDAWRFRWNKNTDTPLPPDEPAGQNPPDGAILHYYLKSAAQGPVTLEILDAQGGVVRRYSSADPVEPLVEGRNTPDYWLRPHRPLAATRGPASLCVGRASRAAGGGRLQLSDLRHPREHAAHAAGVVGRARQGTRVRLTVDGKTQTQPLVVKMDPRVKATAADLKLQYDMSRAIDARCGAARRAGARSGRSRRRPRR